MKPKRLLHLAIPAILLLVSFYLYTKPYYNWDLFPYMALAASKPSIPFDSTHAYIYKEASLLMSSKEFSAIAQRQPMLMQSPAAFRQVLKYYEIKPGYIMVVRLSHFVGFNLLAATYLPSVVSYFFVGLVLFVWLQKLWQPVIAAVLTLSVAAFSFLTIPARFSSPDMLCTTLTLAGLFLISEISVPWGLIICALAISVRPDSVILFVFLNLALYKSNRIRLSTASGLVILGIAITILSTSGNGVLKEFPFTVSDYSSSWTLYEIIQNYFRGIRAGFNSVMSSQTATFIFIAIITLHLRRRDGIKISEDFWSLVTVAALATFAVRYLLHPLVEDRFQISSYLIIILGLCATIGNRTQPKHLNT